MRIPVLASALTIVSLAVSWGSAPLFAQSAGFTGDISSKPPPPTKAGPTPRTTDGKPDLSGLWERPYVPDMTKDNKNKSQIGTPELPFTEAGLKAWKSYDAANGDYTGSCLPFGLMRSMNSPDPIQIMQSP